MRSKAVTALAQHGRIITENSNAARLLHSSGFGKKEHDNRITLSPSEALYLIENKKLQVLDGNQKKVSFDALLKKAKKGHKDFWTAYVVYRDLKDSGYKVKTGLKFGAEFRVYTKGGEHSKWIVFPVYERDALRWHDFSAKNRVAHSTQKKLLIAVVDDEDDVSYWEVSWIKP